MKNRIITDIEQGMQGILDNAQMKQLHEVLTHALFGVEIIKTDESTDCQQEFDNHSLLTTFLSAKKVEGCSEKTLKYYKATSAYMDLAATQDYQIDSLRLHMKGQAVSEWLQITVPHCSIADNSENFSNDNLRFLTSG